ncbi:MAG: hypothetical protein JHC87_08470, partial [Thermoleophilaceae bacterium]|nr:hypothetical protein [Thermoleophilaceae bacterium]
LMRYRVPEAASQYLVQVGLNQGWPSSIDAVVMSDPSQNPPAYHALVAALYTRAYELLPVRNRGAIMGSTARRILRGLIARTAPDGDIAFAARSQEQSWVMSTAMYSAWYWARTVKGQQRQILMSFARRTLDRLKSKHFDGDGSNGIFLTPAARCCAAGVSVPGQDGYFDVTAYTGLTAATLGWALDVRPVNWLDGSARIPSDNKSTFHFPTGSGRFLQHRGDKIYWSLREQGNGEDARYDTAVHVLKVQAKDGAWTDALAPRPYSGGHGRPADPASPCLVTAQAKRCAYLSLRGGHDTQGEWTYQTVWRDLRGTVWALGSATVTPTTTGLKLAWSAIPGQVFKLDHFLPNAKCTATGVTARDLAITVGGQADCEVIAHDYAGGARIDFDRVRSVAGAVNGVIEVTYAAG